MERMERDRIAKRVYVGELLLWGVFKEWDRIEWRGFMTGNAWGVARGRNH